MNRMRNGFRGSVGNIPRTVFAALLFNASLLLLWPVATCLASVTGPCSNCHTMHNSEAGASLVSSPQPSLMNQDCAGCHTSTTSETIVNLNGSRIPIVYNTGGYPSQPLAGGNFFHVAQGGASNDVYGHNVYGISAADTILSYAPGDVLQTCGTPGACHESLANNSEISPLYGVNGCTGCHQAYKHHGTDPADGSPETAESGWYRYLGGHRNLISLRYVEGIEEPDWEQSPSATVHNNYSGTNIYYTNGLRYNHTITAFCRGCHIDFHEDNGGYPDNIGPWLRHPTDLALPTSGEFAAYDPTAAYDPEVPVGWVNPSSPTRAEAIVMCLSCHRAHGSQYPKMLRWDYTTMIAGGGGATDTGCFRCHSQKDGS